MGETLGAVARVLFFVVLGLFTGWVVYSIVRNLLLHRGTHPPGDPDRPQTSGGGDSARAHVPLGPVETDVARLLARARAAAGQGRYAIAISDVHAAMLRRFEGEGLIELHPSRTNGDYARSLRSKPDLRNAFRSVALDVEKVQFGDVPPSADLFRSIYDRVVPLVGKAMTVLLIVVGLGSGAACDRFEPGMVDPSDDTGPSGMKAWVDLLQRNGSEVSYRTSGLDALHEPGTLVLLSDAEVDEESWSQVLAWVKERGGSVIVAGVAPWPSGLGVGVGPGDKNAGSSVSVEWVFADLNLEIPVGDELTEPSGNGVTVLLRRGKMPYATLQDQSGGTSDDALGGHVIVMADDQLFSNIALTAGENASFLKELFGRLPKHVELCDATTTLGAATPMESLSNAHLAPFMIQAWIALALLMLYKGIAFGTPTEPSSTTRRAFVQHVRAVGLAYARSNASQHALGLFCSWAVDRLHQQVNRSGRRGLIPLAEVISARTGQPESNVMNVLLEATGARDDAAPPSSYRISRLIPGDRSQEQQDPSEQKHPFALMRELDRYLAATGGRTTPRSRTGKRR